MLPVPPVPIEDACSTIHDNILYSYSPTAFQSLDLEEGGLWANIGGGVAVTGGACVKSTPTNADAAALYIVGGTANSTDYKGLQRYTFATKKWDSITPSDAVTQDRVWHGATYLNASDSILVYAGSQDGSQQPSSQTFTIQTSEPFRVLAYQSGAPPAVSPLLMPWSDSEALYIGGSSTNTKAMTFSPATGWIDSGASLAEPIYKTSEVKAMVIDGDDRSKMLYTFDMSVSPNTVNRTVLVDGSGSPVLNAKAIYSKRAMGTGLRRRDNEGLNRTVANWPTYNDTLAPSSTRSQYSVASDPDGLVVISGGNDDDVLCMFTARDNCWVNATAKLVSKSTTQNGLGIDSTPTNIDTNSTETIAPVSQPTETAAGAVSSSKGLSLPIKVLIAVLTSIIGVALILIAILLLLRWKRKRRQHQDIGHQRRASGISVEKDGMEFSGLPQTSSARQLRNHGAQPSASSFSSMAILMGRGGQKKSERNSQGSASSSQFNKKYKTAISNPIPQERPENDFIAASSQPTRPERPLTEDKGATSRPRGNGARRGSTRRSSGWNRYWSGGSSLNILGFGSKRTTVGSEADTNSQYSESRPSHLTQSSVMVPPLKFGGAPEMNRVASGSPTVANTSSRFPLTREMSGQIERSSVGSASSYDDDDRRDAFSSGVPASVSEQNSWDPVDRQDWAAGARSQSNAYTESFYAQTLPRSTVGTFPRDTRFPIPPTSQIPTRPSHPTSDMSWLNLGGDSSRV